MAYSNFKLCKTWNECIFSPSHITVANALIIICSKKYKCLLFITTFYFISFDFIYNMIQFTWSTMELSAINKRISSSVTNTKRVNMNMESIFTRPCESTSVILIKNIFILYQILIRIFFIEQYQPWNFCMMWWVFCRLAPNLSMALIKRE